MFENESKSSNKNRLPRIESIFKLSSKGKFNFLIIKCLKQFLICYLIELRSGDLPMRSIWKLKDMQEWSWRYRVSAPPSENSPGNCCGHAVYIRSEYRWFFFLTWRRLFSTGDYFRGGLVTRFRRGFSASLRQMANATSSPPPPPSSSGNIVPADKPVQSDREDDDSPGSLTTKASIFRLRVSIWTQRLDGESSYRRYRRHLCI